MIDVQVTLSQTWYRPSQTLQATVTFFNNDPSFQKSRAKEPQSPPPTRMIRGSKTSSIAKPLDSFTINLPPTTHTTPQSPPVEHAPASPTILVHSPRRASNTTSHTKSKSVSFGGVTSPRTRTASLSSGTGSAFASPVRADHLLIVYAQVIGTFSFDPDYIAGEHFDILKERGLGNVSAGGLVSDSATKSTRWSFTNWTSVLGPTQPSSLAELRQATASKSLPVLSMPASIVDVDLRLQHGERTHRYLSFDVPSGLPPTYTGKAMQIAYVLKLYAQREDNSTTSVECPIQILPDLTTASYDFLRPRLLTRPLVFTSNDRPQESVERHPSISTREDFLGFLDAMQDIARPLPSPVEERHQFLAHPSARADRNRDLRFDIARGASEHVCVLSLPKSAYSPGDVLLGTLDFRKAQLLCFQCTISLEASDFVHADHAVCTPEKTRQGTTRLLSRDRITTAFAIQSQFEVGLPDDMTDSFKVNLLEVQYSLLLEFLLYEQDRLVIETRTKHGLEAAPVEEVIGEKFECRIPLKVTSPDDLTTQGTISKSGTL